MLGSQAEPGIEDEEKSIEQGCETHDILILLSTDGVINCAQLLNR